MGGNWISHTLKRETQKRDSKWEQPADDNKRDYNMINFLLCLNTEINALALLNKILEEI